MEDKNNEMADRAFVAAVHTTLPGSPAPLSSNVGSPYGSALDLERTVSRPHHDGGENQRNLLTVTGLLAKHVKDRILRPDACSDSGRPDD